MRVIVLTPTFEGRDGLSCLSREMTRALAAICPSAHIDVLSLGGSPGTVPVGGAVVSGCDGSRARLAARAIAAAARRPAVVLVLHTHLLPLALPFVAAGASLVHVLVGIESWRAFGALEAAALARARAVLAISAHTRARFQAANARLAVPAVVVVHPAAPAPLAPIQRRPLPPGYALIVGRMAAGERYKGHDRLIAAWPRVLALVPGARLIVAGDGDDRARLERRVRDVGLSDAIQFVGQVDDGTLAGLYGDAGLFVLPSTDEGLGYVFLEAMQAGCACIGAPGAAEEIIEPGVTGVIVAADDLSALSDAVARLLAEPDEARAMGRAGRDRVEQYFTASRFEQDLAVALRPALSC